MRFGPTCGAVVRADVGTMRLVEVRHGARCRDEVLGDDQVAVVLRVVAHAGELGVREVPLGRRFSTSSANEVLARRKPWAGALR